MDGAITTIIANTRIIAKHSDWDAQQTIDHIQRELERLARDDRAIKTQELRKAITRVTKGY